MNTTKAQRQINRYQKQIKALTQEILELDRSIEDTRTVAEKIDDRDAKAQERKAFRAACRKLKNEVKAQKEAQEQEAYTKSITALGELVASYAGGWKKLDLDALDTLLNGHKKELGGWEEAVTSQEAAQRIKEWKPAHEAGKIKETAKEE